MIFMKHSILLTFGFFLYTNAFAQSVAINTDGSTASSSSILDVKSTTKGLLIPRMTKPQRNAIAAPGNGLIVYVNAPDTVGFSYYNGTVWKWLEEKNNGGGNSWNLTGNAGTIPGTHFIGTTDETSLVFGINSIERLRLTKDALLGVGNQVPAYSVDINTGQAPSYPCSNSGLRIKSVAGTPGCNFGLLLGYNDATGSGNDAILWNFGQFNVTPKTISFGLDASLVMMRLESGTAGIGTGSMSPKYALELGTGSTGVNLCARNGLRILPPGETTTGCDNGLFLGYDNHGLADNRKISLWNFAAISGLRQNFIRFGFDTDFSETSGIGESMRIYPPGQGVGINQLNPRAMLHISNNTASFTLPGVMSTSASLPSNEMGFYTGLRMGPTPNDGYVWNYQNAPTMFGTNDVERMRINQNGNVGINTTNPLARLHVADSSVLFTGPAAVPISTSYYPPVEGPGARMMWYPQKAAFRAGAIDATQWNKDNIGIYSLATGAHTTASGPASVAMGFASFAIGGGAIALGSFSYAIGDGSFTTGNGTIASGSNAAALGVQTKAKSNNSLVAGIFNDTTATNRLFEIGNGTANNARNNALTVLTNGNTGIGTSNPLYRLDVGNGSFAFGNSNSRTETRDNAGLQGNAGAQSGFFETEFPVNYPAGASSWWHLIDSRHSNPNNNYALQIAGSFFDQELWFRKTNSNSAQAWSRLLNSTNGWSTTGTFGTNPANNYIGTNDAIDFVLRTTGTERMRISAGGNVGIGTAAPNAPLQFSNSAVNRKLVLYESANNDHQFYGLGINSGTFRYQVDATGADHVFFAAANATSSNELMRIKGNGNIGIGTSSPTKQTEIIGAANASPVTLVIGNRGGFGPAAMEFVSDYGAANQWRPGYIRSNDVGSFTGALEFYTNGTGAGNLYGSVKGLEVRNGVTYTATGTVTSWSDMRLKKDVHPFTGGLDIISQINPVSFHYNNQSPFITDKLQIGVLAQELERIAPYMVDKNVTKDFNDLRSVNNQAYIFLLINAVKELQKEVEELKSKIKL